MKKLILLIIMLLVLISVAPATAQNLYTTGDGYYCISEKVLKNVLHLERQGYYITISHLVYMGKVKTFTNSKPIRLISHNGNIYCIKFKHGTIIWWTTKEGITYGKR